MKKITIDCYSDPGHGWAKVKTMLLHNLGIMGNITKYSYIRGDYCYLEEDCDLTTLCRAFEKLGITYKFRHHYSNKSSKIRSYMNYPYTTEGYVPDFP